ncbi:hypothetical protein HAX54_038479 [Datura stramonium]|uniref:Uncharacterized protein n=1 Tax=Datura stramonium TaxID=4076 RepID=A0ABS8VKK0_DATST|nr:hypothetical protein [Datura stramonium]
MSEQLLFFVTLVARKVFKMKIKPYIPDFKLAFEHFCIHAGGRAVLDELRNLKQPNLSQAPSRGHFTGLATHQQLFVGRGSWQEGDHNKLEIAAASEQGQIQCFDIKFI